MKLETESRAPKGNAVYINRLNKIEVLGLIREHGTISRAEIVEISGLSAPTVSRIVKGLIREEKLVESIGIGDSSGGRPPVMLKFKGEESYVIGIDMGATATRGVLSDLNGKFIEEIKFPTRLSDGFEEIAGDVGDLIQKLAESDRKAASARIFGVGIAVAGLVDFEHNIIEYSPDFKWHNVDIVGELRKKIDYPIIFDNVTRLMALGGLSYGKGKKSNNFICINVGYGIGSGVIIDGELLRGARGFAGEFGHITAERDSKIQCSCEKYGCLEALASGKAIASTAQRLLSDGKKSKILELCKGEISLVTAKTVAEAASQGDELSLRIFNEATDHIGIGIANLVNLFNPEMVIVGGGVSLAGDLFFDNIRRVVGQHVIQSSGKDLLIIPVAFGENAALMGAFALILKRVMDLSLIQ